MHLLNRPIQSCDQWVNRIPEEYRLNVLGESLAASDLSTANDPYCLATLKHYWSLIPLGQEARKPIFSLTVADGAIGSHALAAREAFSDFQKLAAKILDRVEAAVASKPVG